jgi:hypothetical protein
MGFAFACTVAIEEIDRQIKVLIKNLAIFFLCPSKQYISVDIIPNSAVGIFSPKTEGTRT